MHIGEERVKKARVQTLKRDLTIMYMGDSKKNNDFALNITRTVNEIYTLSTKVEENSIIEKLMHSVLNKFQPLISTIEQWGDVEEMSVTKMIGRLRAFEESSKGRHREKEEEQQLLSMCVDPWLTHGCRDC
jgi:hypothetical protein